MAIRRSLGHSSAQPAGDGSDGDRLRRLTRLARRALAADGAFVAVLKPAGSAEIACADGAAPFGPGAAAPLDRPAIQAVLETAGAVELDAPWRAARLGASMLAVPIRVRGEAHGILAAISCSIWSDHDAESLRDAASAMEAFLEARGAGLESGPPSMRSGQRDAARVPSSISSTL